MNANMSKWYKWTMIMTFFALIMLLLYCLSFYTRSLWTEWTVDTVKSINWDNNCKASTSYDRALITLHHLPSHISPTTTVLLFLSMLLLMCNLEAMSKIICVLSLYSLHQNMNANRRAQTQTFKRTICL